PDSELGALRCAPLSTPTPSRSTSSPPSQPVISASTTAMQDKATAPVVGAFPGVSMREYQLRPKRTTTTTLPPPCHSPIDFARVPDGIAHQSTAPKTAASKPPMIPARINESDTRPKVERPGLKPVR